jgi:hypothetical protein
VAELGTESTVALAQLAIDTANARHKVSLCGHHKRCVGVGSMCAHRRVFMYVEIL